MQIKNARTDLDQTRFKLKSPDHDRFDQKAKPRLIKFWKLRDVRRDPPRVVARQ
jgi:hypothetical protein